MVKYSNNIKPPFKPILQVAASREKSEIHILNEPYFNIAVLDLR